MVDKLENVIMLGRLIQVQRPASVIPSGASDDRCTGTIQTALQQPLVAALRWNRAASSPDDSRITTCSAAVRGITFADVSGVIIPLFFVGFKSASSSRSCCGAPTRLKSTLCSEWLPSMWHLRAIGSFNVGCVCVNDRRLGPRLPLERYRLTTRLPQKSLLRQRLWEPTCRAHRLTKKQWSARRQKNHFDRYQRHRLRSAAVHEGGRTTGGSTV